MFFQFSVYFSVDSSDGVHCEFQLEMRGKAQRDSPVLVLSPSGEYD